jgi:hypothetical protein
MTDRPPRGAGDPAGEQGQPRVPGPVEDEDPDIAWGRAIEEGRASGDRFLPPAPKIPGEPDMIFLTVQRFDEYGRPLDQSEPEGLSTEAKARRRLADRLAQTLTDPPYGRVGHDAVAGLSVSTPVDYVPAVKEALTEAAGVAEQNRPSEVAASRQLFQM